MEMPKKESKNYHRLKQFRSVGPLRETINDASNLTESLLFKAVALATKKRCDMFILFIMTGDM